MSTMTNENAVRVLEAFAERTSGLTSDVREAIATLSTQPQEK